MPARPRHRQRILDAAALLFRRQGYGATGLAEILERAGAPKGSLYHYFPGGKEEIGAETVAYAGKVVERTLDAMAEAAPDAVSFYEAYVGALIGWMAGSGFRDGCPISTVVLELSAESDAVAEAASGTMARWQAIMAARLRADGHADPDRVAGVAIAATQGALIRARAMRSPAPLEDVRAVVGSLMRA